MGNLAQSVKRLRESRRLTQAELAELVGVSQSNIHHIEAGTAKKIRYETATKLANVFGVSVDDLMEENGAVVVEPHEMISTNTETLLILLGQQSPKLAKVMRAISRLPDSEQAVFLDLIERQLDILIK